MKSLQMQTRSTYTEFHSMCNTFGIHGGMGWIQGGPFADGRKVGRLEEVQALGTNS